MPTLTIDGRPCSWEGKKSILQVALDNRVEIPHYCYHPGMSVVASCRICLAEVAQPNPRNDNKLELIPKLIPTCQTPAADGMEVHLKNSPKTIANQKSVMEMLLINHPLDCPVCDQAGECSLQDYSYQYGRSQSRFEETKIKQPKKDLGPNVLLYSDRCIMCSRCVRFTREVTGTSEIGIFGRGSSEQIDVFPGRPLDNELSANVIDICPVGALLDKDFLMSMRVWNLTKTPSIDGITASGDNLSIEHNENKIYRLKPRTNMDVNTWWTSDEIRYGWKFIHDPDRLNTPTRKIHGSHEPVSWNDAYAHAVEQLELTVLKKGRGTLALVVSPMLASEEAYLLGRMITALDENAVLAVGPVPFDGEDKTFPGGYTVYAEKAPNARGVRHALEQISDTVLSFDEFIGDLATNRALVLTGNYPSTWSPPALLDAVRDKDRLTVLLDTLPSELTETAEVVLPGVTWAEKSGSFENVNHRQQHFEQALQPIEFAKPEGQIALDLMAVAGKLDRQRYDPARWRSEMGDAFATEMHLPDAADTKVSQVEYVAL
ncbi:MAG: molybdopterin-dependent oxidoreductase [Planctomycetota bacterium]